MRIANIYGLLVGICVVLTIYFGVPTTEKQQIPKTGEKNLKYGVICDAGSSGTRMFVYTIEKKNDRDLVDIDTLIRDNEAIVKKVSPGLSTFAENPHAVIEYIAPLLKFAEHHIPDELVEETPLFIYATAGMRLLPDDKKAALIYNLQTRLSEVTQLKIISSNIKVIDGTWEGIYSWISVNYILGRFSSVPTTPESEITDNTAGMIDMGGASVQIAFELPDDAHNFVSDNVFEINLGSDDNDDYKYKIFSTTFLGYGANEGLQKYEISLIQDTENKNKSVLDSCAPVGFERIVGEMSVQGTGKWDECVDKVEELIDFGKSDRCHKDDTCFLKNTFAPKINMSNVELYGFSEYWYTTYNFESAGHYNFQNFSSKVKKYCSTSWNEIQTGFAKNEYPNAELERLSSNCFKAAWVTTVLHEGFNVDRNNNQFSSVLKIGGEEMQWTLGAMIYHFRSFDDRLSQNVSNTLSILLLILAILIFLFYRQLQIDWKDAKNKYTSMRLEPKSNMFMV